MKNPVFSLIVKPVDIELLIEGFCYIQPDVATISPFTFSLNWSSLLMEDYSGGILFEV